MEQPVTNVDYICPGCQMTLKPPITRDGTRTWVEGDTRHYAHARCLDATQEGEGVDNGGTMVATE